ncbi:hypothetical protein B0I72DRAFT_139251 [Yarrowia lipolytica]|uniref:YALI0E08932p n=2 Tax=Yarrowia lipolytica TaxID=4952 RepID=Q6C6K1_YARLI|nr:YALI0E08932p [Yarrowia lipolytica CLIB122]AOW05145.1 hypothetical protein YALI1_E10899g [Yarrowia lipolytica]KAB8281996.1 hypothetical protein BKA91DRAFT_139219 [Yarrowia lipolytica]KAE8173447.1 hypothetical protein BKA90DRAFT_135752 [Yarrowia lipolytica]KAJ8056695.1 hypothetical protein LXG23DRAFT_33588 [Yarrowia lipolytica]RDW27347.1 hypothetical protein B0I71DRAFT_129246 [Yarrowia lipolytica]|eukprot:XP_503711.1 YALI0E08932p [Yarrowia lipolytica CLIB122]
MMNLLRRKDSSRAMTLPGREGDRERAAALEEQIKILAETASQALDRVGELEQEVAKQQKEIEAYKTEVGEKQLCIERLSNEVGELMTQSVTCRDSNDAHGTPQKQCAKCKSRELITSKSVSTQTTVATTTKIKAEDTRVGARGQTDSAVSRGGLSRDSIQSQDSHNSHDSHDSHDSAAHIEHVARVVVAEEMTRPRGVSTSTSTTADSSFSSSVHSSPSRDSSRDSSFTELSDFSDDDIGAVRTVIMSAEQIKAVDRSNLEHHVTQLQRLLKKSQSRDDDLFRMQKLEAALVAVSRARAVLRKA